MLLNNATRPRSGGASSTSTRPRSAPSAETTRLVKTIETWWMAILLAPAGEVSNARTEGFIG
jgi:transposase